MHDSETFKYKTVTVKILLLVNLINMQRWLNIVSLTPKSLNLFSILLMAIDITVISKLIFMMKDDKPRKVWIIPHKFVYTVSLKNVKYILVVKEKGNLAIFYLLLFSHLLYQLIADQVIIPEFFYVL